MRAIHSPLHPRALSTPVQVRDVLEGVSARLQAQHQLLQRIEAAAADNQADLAPALRELVALKQEWAGRWRGLEAHLSAADSDADAGAGSGSAIVQRSSLYVDELESERQQLQAALAEARQQHADDEARLATAQAAISKLQGLVPRLSAAGGSDDAWTAAGLGAMLAAAPLALPALAAHQTAAAPADPAEGRDTSSAAGLPAQQRGSASGDDDGDAAPAPAPAVSQAEAAWQSEKRVLKSVCRMALAVTMDQVGGGCGIGVEVCGGGDLIIAK